MTSTELTKVWGISDELANKILEVCKMKLSELRKFVQKENIRIPYCSCKNEYILWIVCRLSNNQHVETNHGFSFVDGLYVSEHASYIYTGNVSDITLVWDIGEKKLIWVSWITWLAARDDLLAKALINELKETVNPLLKQLPYPRKKAND